MKNSLLLIFVLCFGFLWQTNAQNVDWAKFDAYAEKSLAEWQIPGAAIAVVKDDKVIYAKGYGVRELGKPEKIDERTIFGVASNSKAFTAAALAILVDEGKIKWTDRVIDVLPDFRLADANVTREIQIRDLLSHRSGLAAYGGDVIWWGANISRDEIVRRARFISPKTSFRTTYAYQNIPFIIAGKIVEKVSGKTWEQFVKERIFAPLQMNDSTTSVAEIKGENRVSPHYRDFATKKTFPIAWRTLEAGAPAAGINSNVMDMANWLRLQINQGEFGGKRIISPPQMFAMQSPQMLQGSANSPNQPKRLNTNFRAYGFGWNIREYAGEKVVQHGGWTDGQLTLTAFMPEQKIGVVVLTNIHNREGFYFVLLNRVFDELLKLEPVDWNAFYLKRSDDAEKAELDARKKREDERRADRKPSHDLAEYAGTYQNDLYGKVEFVNENGKLVVKMTNSPTFIGDVTPWHYDTFKIVWRDPVAEQTFATFTTDENGKIRSVKMAMDDFIEDNEYEYFRQ